MTQPVVKVRDLRKVYGGKNEKSYEALKGINFDVEPGEFVGIMGASGSGKSTLLNLLATLDQPTSGSIEINGRSISNLSGKETADFRAKEIGFIFQDFNLLENMTNAQNMALPLSLQGKSAKVSQPAVRQVAHELGIEALLDAYPTQISGGQKQRVAAARALVTNPELILGDEPTGALDSNSARELLEMLHEINQERHVPILMVTHDPFSASYCQRILFIKDGQIGQELSGNGDDRSTFYQRILDELGTFEQ
ncbi:ABC transporter ATP-binding protein [Levilactobacillus bambusae]|uniref:Bacitracin ABC transporter ATP-binding protein n=1 Tax=Levilactobacillus bambusae TaxID=2024736 RepID=A0A2V1MYG6_9LACO|nr:ABC transporter ATP-binding protein [Levilactobacillus bambusae]PWF99537.1 bacitracin ABC transporter ATP-binding protein [Levilactobacillus bambusae]